MGLFDFLKKKEVQLTDEQKKWNKMWELWSEGEADSPYAELMTYQSEINNGGHGQYFCNIENNDVLSNLLFAKPQSNDASYESGEIQITNLSNTIEFSFHLYIPGFKKYGSSK